jgi:hypothetical protein
MRARRALPSCYFGEEEVRRFAPLGPPAESVRKFDRCSAQQIVAPVILVSNRRSQPDSCAAHKRVPLLSSCSAGEKCIGGLRPLARTLDSVGEFRRVRRSKKFPPVIRLFNRGEYPTPICGHPGNPWIFRKTWPVCGAAESSRGGWAENRANNSAHNSE